MDHCSKLLTTCTADQSFEDLCFKKCIVCPVKIKLWFLNNTDCERNCDIYSIFERTVLLFCNSC